jgi:DHA1 family bicyclomycin/chloramphenicol resistance-like MFS transporter
MGRRLDQVLLLGACTATGPLALNLFLPALPLIQRDFGAGVSEVQLTVSLSLLGFGLGLLLLGPLSDRFGRRPCLLGGLIVFIGGAVVAAFAPNLVVMAIARFALAMAAALVFISARTIVADTSPREELAREVAQVTMINVVAQSMAPLLGNLVIDLGGWQATQGAAALLGLVLLVWVAMRQPETHAGKLQGRPPARTNLLRPAYELLRRGSFRWLMLQVGLLYCAYPAFVATAPHLMVDSFHRPPSQFALYFACLPAGYLLGNLYVMHLARGLTPHQLVLRGSRLAMMACVASFALLLAGFWHPVSMFLPAGLILNAGLGLALPAVSARAVLGAGNQVGTAWGLLGFSQQAQAALAVQLLALFPAASPYPVLVLCLIAVVAAMGIERQSATESTAG